MHNNAGQPCSMTWNGVIETIRLPLLCPRCVRKELTIVESAGFHRVSCRCGWSAKYELVTELSLWRKKEPA